MNRREIIILVLSFLAAGYIWILVFENAFGEEPDDWWLIPSIANDYKSRWVPIYYEDEPFYCGHSVILSNGCYINGVTEEIKIVKSKMYDWASQGCTVHDHEWFHAMGYKHGVGPLSKTCPMFGVIKFSYKVQRGYDPNDPVDWDPNYVYVQKNSYPEIGKTRYR